ncbi:MAG: DUF4430 domain-containing protein [Christensenellales bacterium]|jgi:hypothetical protein
MKKKLTGLLLLLLTLLTIITGCGNAAGSQTSPGILPSTLPSVSTQQDAIAVTVSISCKDAVDEGYDAAIQASESGVILEGAQVTLAAGGTVYDALKAACEAADIPVEESGSGDMLYISAIASLAAGDCGNESGWIYSVNGESGMVSAVAMELSQGDQVSWDYITKFDL